MAGKERSPYAEGVDLFVSFSKLTAGALVGMYFGMLLGRSMIVEFGGNPIDMEIPGAMLGAIVGYMGVRVFVGKKKAGKEEDAKAEAAKAEAGKEKADKGKAVKED